jgi:hypothetical protein
MRLRSLIRSMYNVTLRWVTKLSLPWKRKKYYTFLCMCVRVDACVWVRDRVGVSVCMRTCSLTYQYAKRMRSVAIYGLFG